jgi:hypothetical protein
MIVSCDVCDKQKKAGDHWFIMDIDEDGLHLSKVDFDANFENHTDTVKDVCGPECVIRLTQTFLIYGDLELVRESSGQS